MERGNLAAHHHLPALVQYGMGVVHLSAHHQRSRSTLLPFMAEKLRAEPADCIGETDV
ncbi:Uncharacterised protein [Segatella copri]|nr:Uncharacterised protein [Segatella copri]